MKCTLHELCIVCMTGCIYAEGEPRIIAMGVPLQAQLENVSTMKVKVSSM